MTLLVPMACTLGAPTAGIATPENDTIPVQQTVSVTSNNSKSFRGTVHSNNVHYVCNEGKCRQGLRWVCGFAWFVAQTGRSAAQLPR